jgi:hypothetical protein
VRRYERREVVAHQQVLVEAKCDRCGVTEDEAEGAWLCPVAIEVNLREEEGRRDEYDYCNPCLVAIADVLVAAGSKSGLLTGEDPGGDV